MKTIAAIILLCVLVAVSPALMAMEVCKQDENMYRYEVYGGWIVDIYRPWARTDHTSVFIIDKDHKWEKC